MVSFHETLTQSFVTNSVSTLLEFESVYTRNLSNFG